MQYNNDSSYIFPKLHFCKSNLHIAFLYRTISKQGKFTYQYNLPYLLCLFRNIIYLNSLYFLLINFLPLRFFLFYSNFISRRHINKNLHNPKHQLSTKWFSNCINKFLLPHSDHRNVPGPFRNILRVLMPCNIGAGKVDALMRLSISTLTPRSVIHPELLVLSFSWEKKFRTPLPCSVGAGEVDVLCGPSNLCWPVAVRVVFSIVNQFGFS